MFGAVPTPSSGGMALAQSPLSLAGNPAVGGGGEAGHSSSPGYPNSMSLYAVQQGMAGLSLDGWGAAAAASAAASCDAYGYSVFAPPPLPGAEPAHGQGLLLGSASSPAAAKAATAGGAQQTSSPTGSAGLQQVRPHSSNLWLCARRRVGLFLPLDICQHHRTPLPRLLLHPPTRRNSSPSACPNPDLPWPLRSIHPLPLTLPSLRHHPSRMTSEPYS
jgi:hypothetical protein